MAIDYMLGLSLEFAVFLLFACALAASLLTGVIRGWSILSRLYSLEDRVAVVEGNLLREVKARAGAERWIKPRKEEAAIEAALATPQPTAPTLPFWMNPQGFPRAFNGK